MFWYEQFLEHTSMTINDLYDKLYINLTLNCLVEKLNYLAYAYVIWYSAFRNNVLIWYGYRLSTWNSNQCIH